MILKSKSPQSPQSPQAAAGLKQEQNVAFFLRRAFKDNPEVLVINDFKFSFNDETAQIDHLIVYTYGFVLIESKSIRGHVKVNQQGEWTRSLSTHQGKSNKWQGMASPIKQVELQQALLLELLMHHRSDILGKLLGIKQQGFKGRCWDNICAVSSDSIIDRKSMPKMVSDKLAKTEFLVEKLDNILNLKSKLKRVVNFRDTRPDFKPQELQSVGEFLVNQHIAPKATTAIAPNQPIQQPVITAQPLEQPIIQPETTIYTQLTLICKHCGESTNYTPRYGKFGYYIKCNQCTKNTPMKQACPQCKSKQTRVQKSQETYTLNCQECSFSQQIV